MATTSPAPSPASTSPGATRRSRTTPAVGATTVVRVKRSSASARATAAASTSAWATSAAARLVSRSSRSAKRSSTSRSARSRRASAASASAAAAAASARRISQPGELLLVARLRDLELAQPADALRLELGLHHDLVRGDRDARLALGDGRGAVRRLLAARRRRRARDGERLAHLERGLEALLRDRGAYLRLGRARARAGQRGLRAFDREARVVVDQGRDGVPRRDDVGLLHEDGRDDARRQRGDRRRERVGLDPARGLQHDALLRGAGRARLPVRRRPRPQDVDVHRRAEQLAEARAEHGQEHDQDRERQEPARRRAPRRREGLRGARQAGEVDLGLHAGHGCTSSGSGSDSDSGTVRGPLGPQSSRKSSAPRATSARDADADTSAPTRPASASAHSPTSA